jgi:type II secretory pathway pseudopilin PulG
MKKIFGLIISFVLLAGAALPAAAQTPRGRYDSRAARQRAYEQRQRDYRYDGRYDDDRSVWEKSRDKLTVAGGTAAGAAVSCNRRGRRPKLRRTPPQMTLSLGATNKVD